MVFRFIEGLHARDGATIGVGLSRSVERRDGVRVGGALGVLHYLRRRLVMKLRRNGLWSGWAALPYGRRVTNLAIKLRDLLRAWAAMSGAATADDGDTRRDDQQADVGGPPNGFMG
jgi:hypothetical protein